LFAFIANVVPVATTRFFAVAAACVETNVVFPPIVRFPILAAVGSVRFPAPLIVIRLAVSLIVPVLITFGALLAVTCPLARFSVPAVNDNVCTPTVGAVAPPNVSVPPVCDSVVTPLTVFPPTFKLPPLTLTVPLAPSVPPAPPESQLQLPVPLTLSDATLCVPLFNPVCVKLPPLTLIAPTVNVPTPTVTVPPDTVNAPVVVIDPLVSLIVPALAVILFAPPARVPVPTVIVPFALPMVNGVPRFNVNPELRKFPEVTVSVPFTVRLPD